MQPVNPMRRDPAPSRLSYRLHRLWLRPSIRALVRFGLPLAVIIGAGAWFYGQESYRLAVQSWVSDARRSIEERPEFMVHAMVIDGASPTIAEDIREIVPVDFPISSFDLDLLGMKDRIAELDAVERADLRVRSGGILQVDIVERIPAAVWRNSQGIELLDKFGFRVGVIDARSARPDLPLLAGAGAEKAVAEALRLIEIGAPVADQLRGLVRVGERRWDVVLTGDKRIQLPEKNALDAFEQVLALNEAQDLLSRDLRVVDFRNPKRPTVRLGKQAIEQKLLVDVTKSGG